MLFRKVLDALALALGPIALSTFAQGGFAENHDPHHLAAEVGGSEFAIFAGAAFERRRNGFALGLEYDYRLSERWSLGGIAEHTWGDLDFGVFAIPLTLHAGAWKFSIAPGLELSDGEHELLGRISAGYEFHFAEHLLTPSLSVDVIDGESAVVIGLSYGL